MAIVASVIVEDRAQIDGRRSIIERHTDHLGVPQMLHYLAESGADVNAAMLARVAALGQAAADAEMVQNIAHIMVGDYGKVTTQYVTVADARAVLRAIYQTGSGEVIGRMAGYLLTLPDSQLRSIFNMTQAEVNQLKPRLQARYDALLAVLTATGE